MLLKLCDFEVAIGENRVGGFMKASDKRQYLKKRMDKWLGPTVSYREFGKILLKERRFVMLAPYILGEVVLSSFILEDMIEELQLDNQLPHGKDLENISLIIYEK